MEEKKYITYEEAIPVIDEELAKRRRRWRLKAIKWISYEDVCQIIRLHFFNKWHLYDQKQPLAQWVNKVITNRTTNIVRDIYARMAPPCQGCEMNEGGERCRFTPSGDQCEECPIYAKWKTTREVGYNLVLAKSIDDPNYLETEESSLSPAESIDISAESKAVVERMETLLHPLDFKIFKELFLENKTEVEVANSINLSGKDIKLKCKYIKSRKKVILETGKSIILSGDY